MLLSSLPLSAQNQKPTATTHSVSVGFLTEAITHPGIAVGHQMVFKKVRKEKTKKNGKVKIHDLEWSWDSKLGFYNHRRNHNGFLLNSGITLSRTNGKGNFFSGGLLLGTHLKKLNDDVYQINPDGSIDKIGFAGNLGMSLGFKTQIGKHFSYKNPNNNFSWFLSSTLLFTTQFSSPAVSHSLLELGILYHLKK